MSASQLSLPATGYRQWVARLAGAEIKVWKLQDCAPEYNRALDNPEALVEYLTAQLPGSVAYQPDVENLICVHLTVRKKPITWNVISHGIHDTLLVHPGNVFRTACLLNSAAIVVAHNHPSGDPTPSEADVKVTRDLIRAGQLMKIEVLDHVILGRATEDRPKAYASLRELGYFWS